ncbi:ephrin type-A receptor 6 [Arapaima gigas]
MMPGDRGLLTGGCSEMRSGAMICLLLALTRVSLADPGHGNQVVLLDTTAVLGELGWKTYPVNGVSPHSPGVPGTLYSVF